MMFINFFMAAFFVPAYSFTFNFCDNTPRSNRNELNALNCDDSFEQWSPSLTRRSAFGALLLGSSLSLPGSSWAATREPLEDLLYRILRVREATVQETRLIKSGKFKDIQRANIKLAVKFMIENYRLNDAFVAASTYVDESNRRLEASQIGQSTTQNLYTILEYFDAADVQNLKVSGAMMIVSNTIFL